MSDQAFEEFNLAREAQLSKNDARRIRTKIDDARSNPPLTGMRWPFELLQNAHDAHPRPGKATIDVAIDCCGGKVIFEHDSAPFSSSDLAALLSGGSGKELESEETTGRFGTGFLSTHVLSTRVVVSGIFAATGGYEYFQLVLDRDGDESSIVENIKACNTSIRAAVPLAQLNGIPSARFEYEAEDPEIVDMGLDSLRQALPYLFSTCENLGRVEVRLRDGSFERWTPTGARCRPCAGWFVQERIVTKVGRREVKYRSLRVTDRPDSRSAVLLIAEQTPSGWSTVIPAQDAPRLFRQFPIRPSNFLQTALVIDAPFDVNQERNRIHLNEPNRDRAKAALAAWPAALVFAFEREWSGRHRLAQLGLSKTAFAADNGTQGFWRDELAALARRIALMPIIETRMGYLRGVEDDSQGWWADFLVPGLSDALSAVAIDIDRFWPSANDVASLAPPVASLARDWSAIGLGWRELEVPVSVATLETVAETARRKAETVDDLNVQDDVDALGWIARFVDLVGECWARAGAVSPEILSGLLPDQHGKLRSLKDLSKDAAVSESLKDTAALIGYDARARLLDRALESAAAEHRLQFFTRAIESAGVGKLDESAIVETCLGELDKQLPGGKLLADGGKRLFEGSIRLLDHIWQTKRENGRTLAHRCPFVAGNKYIARCTAEPGTMMMAPIIAWHETARPFAKIYGPQRVLHPDYKGDAARKLPDVVGALVRWGVAHGDPLIVDTPQELKDERLRAIAADPESARDVTVANALLSQIALLPNELITRCESNEEFAHALLGLVLCHIAPHDPRWREFIVVKGRKKDVGEVELRIRGAHWLAHMKARSWIPVRVDSGKPPSVPATPESLRRLLEPHSEWLRDNEPAVELLTECFGFDELDLRLLGVTSNAETRRKLRAGLARLVDVTGANPEELERLAEEVVEDQRMRAQVEQSRTLGLAVQDAIRQSLENHKLTTELVDRGFDYEVKFDFTEPASGDDPSMKITIGSSYLVEIKSTRTGEVRLTPTQAMTASLEKHRYVLCVVDLRAEPADTLDRVWTAADVEPLASMLPDIGESTQATWALVSAARSTPVAIRKDDELRYAVPETLWSIGVSINTWIAAVMSLHTGSGPSSPEAAPGGAAKVPTEEA